MERMQKYALQDITEEEALDLVREIADKFDWCSFVLTRQDVQDAVDCRAESSETRSLLENPYYEMTEEDWSDVHSSRTWSRYIPESLNERAFDILDELLNSRSLPPEVTPLEILASGEVPDEV